MILVETNPAGLLVTVKTPTDPNALDPLDSVEEMPLNTN
jgi:hypothetical protein